MVKQPSFGEEHDVLSLAWGLPTGGRNTEFKVKQALLRIAWDAQSLVIGPGSRRLALEAVVGDRALREITEKMRASGELVRTPGPVIVGRPIEYELHALDVQREGRSTSERLTTDQQRTLRDLFLGHENAWPVLNQITRPSSAKEASYETGLSLATVYRHLNWLTDIRLATKPSRGVWVFNTGPEPVVIDVEVPERSVMAAARYQDERESFRRYFARRYQIDNVTGEILDER